MLIKQQNNVKQQYLKGKNRFTFPLISDMCKTSDNTLWNLKIWCKILIKQWTADLFKESLMNLNICIMVTKLLITDFHFFYFMNQNFHWIPRLFN